MNKKGKIFIISGLVLIICALCLTSYNIIVSLNAEKKSKSTLERINRVVAEEVSEAENTDVYPDYIINPKMDMPVIEIDGLDYVGTVIIPAFDIELPVFSEYSSKNLTDCPCRYSGSVYLDNMIVCAHNYASHFGRLNRLSIGDCVIFKDTKNNVFNYKVICIEMLSPDETEEMQNGNSGLTLFTCTPGGSTRVTVRCEKA